MDHRDGLDVLKNIHTSSACKCRGFNVYSYYTKKLNMFATCLIYEIVSTVLEQYIGRKNKSNFNVIKSSCFPRGRLIVLERSYLNFQQPVQKYKQSFEFV